MSALSLASGAMCITLWWTCHLGHPIYKQIFQWLHKAEPGEVWPHSYTSCQLHTLKLIEAMFADAEQQDKHMGFACA